MPVALESPLTNSWYKIRSHIQNELLSLSILHFAKFHSAPEMQLSK